MCVDRDALHSPPLQGRNNKILWVSRIPLTGDPLVIKATLGDGTRTAPRLREFYLYSYLIIRGAGRQAQAPVAHPALRLVQVPWDS